MTEELLVSRRLGNIREGEDASVQERGRIGRRDNRNGREPNEFRVGSETPKSVAYGSEGSLGRERGQHSGRVGGWRGVRAEDRSLQHVSNIEAQGEKPLTGFDQRGVATWSRWKLRPADFFGRSRWWLSDKAL